MKSRLLFSMVTVLCTAGIAHAGPITYTISATASGSLNGVSFTNELVTLTMNADTSGIMSGMTGGLRSLFSIDGTVSLNVAATGSEPYGCNGRIRQNQVGVVGFTDETAGPLAVLDTFDLAFSTYALSTAIGPVTDTSFINSGQSFPTTGGALIINSAPGIRHLWRPSRNPHP